MEEGPECQEAIRFHAVRGISLLDECEYAGAAEPAECRNFGLSNNFLLGGVGSRR